MNRRFLFILCECRIPAPNMRMNTAIPFSIVLPVLILFSIDPEASLLADKTYKQNYRDIVLSAETQ
jgi:hypothetical protein